MSAMLDEGRDSGLGTPDSGRTTQISASLATIGHQDRLHSSGHDQPPPRAPSPESRVPSMGITIDQVSKRFGSTTVLESLSLKVEKGELIALLGPSGSGKTTLLRIIGGLEAADGGRVLFGEQDTAGWPIQKRKVGFVFQHYALFRHMNVFENIAFGLRALPRKLRPPAEAISRRVMELLELVKLPEAHARYPTQLSGGQQQRVALARALAIDPRVLLLDEPFGALDAQVRVELRRWLRQIHDATGYTTVFVTHDQEEALELADRVVVLHRGRIEQVGTPTEIYQQPASAFVFAFIGRGSVLRGVSRLGRFRPDGGVVDLALPPGVELPDGPAQLCVRPHDLRLVAAGNGLTGRVRMVRVLAGRATLELELPAQPAVLEVDLDLAAAAHIPQRGDVVAVQPLSYRVFPG